MTRIVASSISAARPKPMIPGAPGGPPKPVPDKDRLRDIEEDGKPPKGGASADAFPDHWHVMPSRHVAGSALLTRTPLAPTPRVQAPGRPAAAPDAAMLRAEGAAAERERITRIQAMAAPGREQLIAEAIAAGATPQATALRILQADRARSAARLEAIAGDEVMLHAPTPLSPEATDAGTPQAEVQRILAIHRRLQGG